MTPPRPISPDFDIKYGKGDEPWSATDGYVSVTVMPSKENKDPSKRLDGRPALMWKDNHIHKAGSPEAWREQFLICELNGVFVHIQNKDGKVAMVMADRRLG